MTPAYALARLETPSEVSEEVLRYLERIQATLDPFGGRFLVHGGPREVLEGPWTGDVVLIEFPDRAHAESWYRSAAYEEIKPLRTAHIPGTVLLIDGVDADHDSAEMAAALRRLL